MKKKRTCLRCDTLFMSNGPEWRICSVCYKGIEYTIPDKLIAIELRTGESLSFGCKKVRNRSTGGK